MEISVTDPVDRAMKKTRAILFEPFDIGKWFCIGFCAFLAYLGTGGGRANVNVPGNFGSRAGSGTRTPNFGGSNDPFKAITDSFDSNMPLVIGIGIGIVVFAIVLTLVFMWLRARGQFMFIHAVSQNSGAIAKPWKEYAVEAHSLFMFNICFALLSTAIILLLMGGCVLLAWQDISAKTFGPWAVSAIGMGLLSFLSWFVVVMIFQTIVDDFVVPTMFKRRIRFMEAYHVVRDVFSPHKGTIALYFLMLIGLSFGVGFVVALGTCCLCCIPALPYIGTVIFLPVYVFLKAYNLYFLEQFGPEWKFFVDVAEVEPDELNQLNAA